MENKVNRYFKCLNCKIFGCALLDQFKSNIICSKCHLKLKEISAQEYMKYIKILKEKNIIINNKISPIKSNNLKKIKKKKNKKILGVDTNFELSLKIKGEKRLYYRDINEKERKYIRNIFELTDNRIAVLNNKELKIYSRIFKFITKIDNFSDKDIYIEIKNKDIARIRNSYIDFFKLCGKNYKLFQTIDEDKIKINSILSLMNGNILTCNDYGINIYSKDKNKYKLILKNIMEANIKGAIVIGKNKLIIFEEINKDYFISFYEIEKK